MKSETAGNAIIGVGGTLLALITPDRAAILAGVATAAWMIWQLGAAIYDRLRK